MKTQGLRRPKAARAGPLAMLLVLCGAMACSGGSARDAAVDGDRPAAVSLDSIYASSQSGVEEPLRSIIRDDESWEAAWRVLTGDGSPPPPRPEIDFERHILIVVGLGSRPSGGYAARVTAVASQAGRLRVTVLEVAPGPGCLATMALTSPVVVVRAARFDGPVEFVETHEERSCD